MGAADRPWEVDTSYLSYRESGERVLVSKTMANLTRRRDNGSVTVNLIHDTMSGASPTGAVRSSDSVATFTTASGAGGFSAGGASDYSLSTFEDTRVQAGLGIEQELSRLVSISYGGSISQESDYDSLGANVDLSRESNDRLTTYNLGLGYTTDSIYRSDTGDTPEPLGNIDQYSPYTKGARNTVDGQIGVSHILNKRTIAQLNLSVSASEGYHSDPYKIISAVDDSDRILANFHDSRPNARLRTSVYGKLVHQLKGTAHSVHVSYRIYQDDWGIQSQTADFRFHHTLSESQYLEPHMRFYRQSEADFYRSSLGVDSGLNPVLPDDGFASADYRLDAMSSSTLGIKYGLKLTAQTDFRIRAEYLNQQFATAAYSRNTATILQTSFRIRF